MYYLFYRGSSLVSTILFTRPRTPRMYYTRRLESEHNRACENYTGSERILTTYYLLRLNRRRMTLSQRQRP